MFIDSWWMLVIDVSFKKTWRTKINQQILSTDKESRSPVDWILRIYLSLRTGLPAVGIDARQQLCQTSTDGDMQWVC